MLGGFMDRLRFVPYKVGEPKRLMALLVGVVGLAAGYSITGIGKWHAGWKTFLMSFGAVSIAAFVAGVLNPVTLYNRNHYGSTTQWPGYIAGTGDTGLLPAGNIPAYYGADLVEPGQCFVNGVWQTCASVDPALPSIGITGTGSTGTQHYGSTTFNYGNVTGQADIDGKMGRGGIGEFYSASIEELQPRRPELYGSTNVVPFGMSLGEREPMGGDIYLRAIGEVSFNGGI